MAPRLVANTEAWRQEYRANRYMAAACAETLLKRSQDLGRNMFWVNNKGQLSVRSATAEDQRWWALWTHFLEECQLRGMSWQQRNLFDEDWVKSIISAPEPPKGLSVLKGRTLPKEPYLARLGQAAHLKASYTNGAFRVAPASAYADPSLTTAIADDELSIETIRSVTVLPPGRPAATSIQRSNPSLVELTRRVRTSQNYFVLCASAAYDPRLMTDFAADALLVVRKPATFSRRLQHAVARARPDLTPWFGPVEYYDPYRAEADAARIPMLKNFRYAYQNEFRFAWLSTGTAANWAPFFVEIGSMRDIADLYL